MLLRWIAEIADEPLLLEPTDRAAEQRTNTWSLSAEPDDTTRLSASEIVAAFESTAFALRARAHASGFSGHATFYVWYDPQAGLLRCSTGSVGADELPFAGVHEPVGDLRPVVEAFLGDSAPGFVAWPDLEDIAQPTESESESSPLLVWVRSVGGAVS